MNATGWGDGAGTEADKLVLDRRGRRQHLDLVREAVPGELADRLAQTWVVT